MANVTMMLSCPQCEGQYATEKSFASHWDKDHFLQHGANPGPGPCETERKKTPLKLWNFNIVGDLKDPNANPVSQMNFMHLSQESMLGCRVDQRGLFNKIDFIAMAITNGDERLAAKVLRQHHLQSRGFSSTWGSFTQCMHLLFQLSTKYTNNVNIVNNYNVNILKNEVIEITTRVLAGDPDVLAAATHNRIIVDPAYRALIMTGLQQQAFTKTSNSVNIMMIEMIELATRVLAGNLDVIESIVHQLVSLDIVYRALLMTGLKQSQHAADELKYGRTELARLQQEETEDKELLVDKLAKRNAALEESNEFQEFKIKSKQMFMSRLTNTISDTKSKHKSTTSDNKAKTKNNLKSERYKNNKRVRKQQASMFELIRDELVKAAAKSMRDRENALIEATCPVCLDESKGTSAREPCGHRICDMCFCSLRKEAELAGSAILCCVCRCELLVADGVQ